MVTNSKYIVEDWLFRGIERHAICRRVRHDVDRETTISCVVRCEILWVEVMRRARLSLLLRSRRREYAILMFHCRGLLHMTSRAFDSPQRCPAFSTFVIFGSQNLIRSS